MDRFMTMTTFVQVVRKSSFTSAARTLGISRALVSRHIAELEAHLGVRLLNRTTRSISMTEAGKEYFDFCTRILDEISSVEGQITDRNDEAEGNLSVIVPKWIGSMDIADAVTEFCLAYPGITMNLHLGGMSQKTYDFIERGFDVALHTRNIPDSLVRVKKIATLHYAMVATPGCIARHGMPEHPRDLAEKPCITQDTDQSWRFLAGDTTLTVKGKVAASSNTYLVLRKMVLGGLGFGVLPRQMVREDIVAGELVDVLPEYPLPERPLYAVFAPGGTPPKKIRVFNEFLSRWFKKHPIE